MLLPDLADRTHKQRRIIHAGDDKEERTVEGDGDRLGRHDHQDQGGGDRDEGGDPDDHRQR